MVRSSLGLAALASVACAQVYDTRFEGTTWDDANWIIKSTNLDQGHYQSRISLANGYIGINLASLGPFFEADVPVDGDNIFGWPLFARRQSFATVAGFYDSQPQTNGSNFPWLYQYGWDSAISGVPHWAGLHIKSGGNILRANTPASQISNFSTSLSISDATMNWKFLWSPGYGPNLNVEYTVFVHKLRINQAAVQLKVSSEQNAEIEVIDVLEGEAAVRTTFVDKGYGQRFPLIWSAVSPNGTPNVTAWVFSSLEGDSYCRKKTRRRFEDSSLIGTNSSSIAQSMKVHLKRGETSTVTKYVGVASTDDFAQPKEVAWKATRQAAETGFEKMHKSHAAEWASILTRDSVDRYYQANGSLPQQVNDENIVELQILAVTNPFFLLQQTVGSNAIAAAGNNTGLGTHSISVGGLGSDAYAGQIFWDADVWMAPGLLPSFPEAAKQIAEYRVAKFPQARENIKTAYQSSQNKTGKFSTEGAIFPWTSGRYGNCTATGPCFDYEYHLNGDIGLEMYSYLALTGDAALFKKDYLPIYDAVAQMYADLVTWNETLKAYELYNGTDPDEYANFEDNIGFTMALMKVHIDSANDLHTRFGLDRNETWANISSQILIPAYEPANIIKEYADMNDTVEVKQADVVLVDDFLNWPNKYTLSDLDYYAGKQSLNGPGMTYGVFSIVANRESPSGCSSYTYDLYSSQPYLRGPWFQYSEQMLDDWQTNGHTHPAYPFHTGMGGASRIAIYGYLGLRVMLDSLSIDPSLPPQIPQIHYRKFYWQGWPIDAVSTQTHTTLKRLQGPLPSANQKYADSIPVAIGLNSTTNLTLTFSAPLVIPNRQIGNIKSVANNIAQCLPVTSNRQYRQGQFPLAAVDGASSTKWQPISANESSSISIHLSEPYVPIKEVMLDWAQSPPKSFRLVFTNTSADPDTTEGTLFTEDNNVKISSPYDAVTAYVIKPVGANTTNITVDTPKWSGKYAILTIEGNQGDGGVLGYGASVAEVAIVAENGRDVVKRL
ncbi:carbohydrate-binding module family 32 protein [Piedraia hortae CBS 480.64]|uniref:alpha,alpha-trehalase n=1 Tax=Piedraia hortae CBS 480.64 TaxID=1314780 RepID=A0A6A7BZZ1_9PEZI|nr:carbohydrate-binding module family 32 protein [Piedraia hortae CBS 480.64]